MIGRMDDGRRYGIDIYGGYKLLPDVSGMFSPVRCTHCRDVYDVGKVTVTARYLDCSVWKSPCCKRTVDDRGKGWKSFPDIEWLNKDGSVQR